MLYSVYYFSYTFRNMIYIFDLALAVRRTLLPHPLKGSGSNVVGNMLEGLWRLIGTYWYG